MGCSREWKFNRDLIEDTVSGQPDAKDVIKRIRMHREHFRENFDGLTDIQVNALSAYVELGTTTLAAEAVGIHRRTFYNWSQAEENFARAYEDAKEMKIERLEAVVEQRAIFGHPDPIMYQGKKVGERRIVSDNLLMFYLKKHRPEYRDQHELKVTGQVDVVNRIAGLSEDDMRKLAQTKIESLESHHQDGDIIDVETDD